MAVEVTGAAAQNDRVALAGVLDRLGPVMQVFPTEGPTQRESQGPSRCDQWPAQSSSFGHHDVGIDRAAITIANNEDGGYRLRMEP